MIENSDRGITLNKGLAWTLASGLLLGGLWVGTTVAELKGATGALTSTLADLKSQIRDGESADTAFEGRVRALENTVTRADARFDALSRSLDEVKATLRDQTEMLRQISLEGAKK
jgi:hypothetical protein